MIFFIRVRGEAKVSEREGVSESAVQENGNIVQGIIRDDPTR